MFESFWARRAANKIRRVPVLERGAVIGVISIRDATGFWLNAPDEENQALRRLVAQLG